MTRSIRFAVVGLGPFAETAILPAIHRQRGASIAALVSTAPAELHELGRQYGAERVCDYAEYGHLLASGRIDAVYVTLPIDLRAAAVMRAAEHGVHVLCDRPMAPTVDECRAMIDTCHVVGVRLMVAYRLPFQAATLDVIDLVERGAIGMPRVFTSVASVPVEEEPGRVDPRVGAGPLYTLGVDCVSAARHIFRDEPVAVHAHRITRADEARFHSVEGGVAATLRFSGGRVATFVCSHDAVEHSQYTVVGTEGVLEVEHPYAHSSPMAVTVIKQGRRRRRSFRKSDQIASQVHRFVRCIRNEIDPEPSGGDALADVRVIEAIQEAVRTAQQTTIVPIRSDPYSSPGSSTGRSIRPVRMLDAPGGSR